jgi:hypothetical protein
MTQYMVEIPHSREECPELSVHSDGALPPADSNRSYSGCARGLHRTWVLMDVETEEEAWSVVPALLRDTARVVPLDGARPAELKER